MDLLTTSLATAAIVINWTVVLAGMPHQMYKLFKTKNAKGLSTVTFSLYLVAFLFGFIYGVDIKNPALIYGNIPTVAFSAIILGQIIYYKRFRSNSGGL